LYYYNYIDKDRAGDNIYSFLGTVVHELTQSMIQGQISNSDSVTKFIDAVDDAEMLDLKWINEKVENKYVNCIIHFLENFNPLSNDTIRIEDEVEIEIDGVVMRGFIDLWYRIGNTIYIIDLKTSTKFKPNELPKKSRQLVFYAYALKKKYPEYDIVIQFNMLKYALVKGKLQERTNLNIFDEFEDGIVDVEFTVHTIRDLKKYISETVNDINKLNKQNMNEWTLDKDPEKDFFCRNLCGHREKCLGMIRREI
jgi:hypothetical protein